MLDPDWSLPAQNWCRDTGNANCYWRGQLGQFWGDDCSADSDWAAWHANYLPWAVKYATLAQETGVDAFLVLHELEEPARHCPDLWMALLQAIRAVYSGQVSAAFNPDTAALLPPAVTSQPWVSNAAPNGLDFIGIDCYLDLHLPPYPGTNVSGYTHPLLPWQDTNASVINAGFDGLMPAFAALSNSVGGKKIVCTEVGWPSRPWAYSGIAGIVELDPEDCSVVDQCATPAAQALAYAGFLQSYYAQPWFDGVLFWTWRVDPTSGGPSDVGFSPAGKPTASLLRSFWGSRTRDQRRTGEDR